MQLLKKITAVAVVVLTTASRLRLSNKHAVNRGCGYSIHHYFRPLITWNLGTMFGIHADPNKFFSFLRANRMLTLIWPTSTYPNLLAEPPNITVNVLQVSMRQPVMSHFSNDSLHWIMNTCNHGHILKPKYWGECITSVHAPTSDRPLLKWPSSGWMVNTCNHSHLLEPEYYSECIASVVSFSECLLLYLKTAAILIALVQMALLIITSKI